MNRTAVKLMLVRHEGLRTKPYKDTVGKLTIGVGRNLDDVGLSEDEVQMLLDNDITRVYRELLHKIACFGSLDDARQHALIDMGFNLGVGGLLQFTKMLDALERRDFEAAANEAKESRWFVQVGKRGEEVVALLRGAAS